MGIRRRSHFRLGHTIPGKPSPTGWIWNSAVGPTGSRTVPATHTDNYYLANPYLNLIREGKVGTTELDDKVRRILRLIFRTVMNPDRPWGSMLSPEHYEAARRIGEEGIVLLQNKGNVLPIDLNRAKKILVVGENAIKMMTVGGGSSSLKVQRELSPLDGITACGRQGRGGLCPWLRGRCKR